MHKSSLAALAVLGIASAQDSVLNLFLVGFTSQSIVGSIVTSDASATTYSLNCGDPNNCGGLGGIPQTGLLFTEGTSTVTYNYVNTDISLFSISAPVTIDIGCSYSSLNGACSGSGTADIAGSTTTISEILTSFTDGGAALGGGQDVTLTAGPLPTNSGSAATITPISTGSQVTTSRTTKTSTSPSSGATGGAEGGGGSSSSSSSSSSSKAAAPVVTQAPWIVGGAAAALVYAAMP